MTDAHRYEHRVEYDLGGRFFIEQDSQPVESWDVGLALASLPEYAQAFRFKTLLLHDPITVDGREMRVSPVETETSGTYFPGGEVVTLAQVEAMGDQMSILASNMRGNGWPEVVRTRIGTYFPYEPGDTILPAAEGARA